MIIRQYFIITLIFISLPAFSQAATLDGDPPKPKWEIGVGLSAASVTEYVGSTHRDTYVVPFPYFIYRGEYVQIEKKSLIGKLYESENTEVDLSFGGSLPVSNRKGGPRDGMPELDGAIEAGITYKHRFYKNTESHIHMQYDIPLRAVISSDFKHVDHRGYVSTPHVSIYKHFYPDKTHHKISYSIGPVFGTRKYHDYFYGVDEEYVTATRAEHEGKSGYSGTRMTLGYSYKSSGKWWFSSFLRYWNASSSAFEDSDLVNTKHSLAFGFAIGTVWKEGY